MICHFTWFAIMPKIQYILFLEGLNKILKNTISNEHEIGKENEFIQKSRFHSFTNLSSQKNVNIFFRAIF